MNWDVKGTHIIAIVTGIEPQGIWIRNPNFKVKFKRDESDNPIPEDKQKFEEVEADMLLRWEYIKGVLDIKDKRVHVLKFTGELGFVNQ
jgi:hypothetical protein